MSLISLSDRSIIAVSGADRHTFLQGLITQDIKRLSPEQPLYACLLNPQGKVLFDFFLYEQGEEILLDVWSAWQEELQKRLKMYKLRADVEVATKPALKVYATFSEMGAADPRHAEMGRRILSEDSHEAESDGVYHQKRIALGIPDSADFIEGRSFTAEYGIADLHGVSYSKGCYVGQEVVARSKSRGVLRKAVHIVEGQQPLPATGTVVTLGEKEIGQLRSHLGTQGIAMLRIEDVQKAQENNQPLMAGEVEITAKTPEWLQLSTENTQAAL